MGQAIALYDDPDSVGVHLMAFEEVVPLFIEAGEQNAIFATVKWYGSDCTALNKELVNSTQAAQFAIMTGFPNPLYGGIRSEIEQYGLIEGQIRDKIGRYPETNALAAYDALLVESLANLATGKTNDIEALKKAVLHTAESYLGATGLTRLNDAGDRDELSIYHFWAVRADNGSFQWLRVARYMGLSNGGGRLTYERQSALTPALRVLVVNSYHKGMDWEQEIQKGIIEGLSREGYIEGQDYELKTFCMDTKVTPPLSPPWKGSIHREPFHLTNKGSIHRELFLI